ncbi:hypothetical protein [Microcystis aeruginosa]|uniref:hypothetical protein n=1 Tax=Microcystis aeruginosa TaxID=1126 RepID=UPI001562C9A7|nr:hypothetical protein [Microcystis aeruginosa]
MLQSPRIPDSVKGNLTVGDLDNQNSSLFQCTINDPLKMPFLSWNNFDLSSQCAQGESISNAIDNWTFLRSACCVVISSDTSQSE